jgi:hypothetical protein
VLVLSPLHQSPWKHTCQRRTTDREGRRLHDLRKAGGSASSREAGSDASLMDGDSASSMAGSDASSRAGGDASSRASGDASSRAGSGASAGLAVQARMRPATMHSRERPAAARAR